MLLLAKPLQAARGKDTSMHSIPAYHADQALRLANERLDGFRAESEMLRLAAKSRASKPSTPFAGLRAAVGSLRSAMTGVDVDSRPVTPTLSDYPFRA
jgi:hypothetical protein